MIKIPTSTTIRIRDNIIIMTLEQTEEIEEVQIMMEETITKVSEIKKDITNKTQVEGKAVAELIKVFLWTETK